MTLKVVFFKMHWLFLISVSESLTIVCDVRVAYTVPGSRGH